MKRIYDRIGHHREQAKDHALFRDIALIPDQDIPERLRTWAPLFVHLAMTFRDINQLYFAYLPPANDYEREINAHAEIDSTHWRFLLDDLKAIGLEHHVQSYEQAVTRIWPEEGLPIRHYIYSVVSRAQACGTSPLLRAAVMESGEATVKLFFSTTRLVAKRFQQVTGKTLRYFGDDHILSETNHPVDSRLFAEVVLDDDIAKHALSKVDAHFHNFGEFLDYKYLITFGRAAR